MESDRWSNEEVEEWVYPTQRWNIDLPQFVSHLFQTTLRLRCWSDFYYHAIIFSFQAFNPGKERWEHDKTLKGT